MSDPFLGEIRMFGGNYAPRNWALCDGQLVSTNQNEALFSLLNSMYGGDGVTTFALPDMRGRLPVHVGTGPGMTRRYQGSRFGYENVSIVVDQLPAHNHPMVGSKDSALTNQPQGHVFATTAENFYDDGNPIENQKDLSPSTIGYSGEGQLHSNLMPFLCITFIIAMVGAYPPRS